MENKCEFKMMVKAKDAENVINFYNALSGNDPTCLIGQGAKTTIEWKEVTNNKVTAIIEGSVAESIITTLMDDAYSIENQRVHKNHTYSWDKFIEKYDCFIPLPVACKKYGVNMEAYSKEPYEQFMEHVKYSNGNWKDDWNNYKMINSCKKGRMVMAGGFSGNFNLADVR